MSAAEFDCQIKKKVPQNKLYLFVYTPKWKEIQNISSCVKRFSLIKNIFELRITLSILWMLPKNLFKCWKLFCLIVYKIENIGGFSMI